MEKPWIKTDPDREQYGRTHKSPSKWCFEFKEGNVQMFINLEDYTTEQMQKCISSYGYSLNPASSYFIFDIYPNKETVNVTRLYLVNYF